MAEYPHLGPAVTPAEPEPGPGALVVELDRDRGSRTYPGDYRARVDDGVLAIYSPGPPGRLPIAAFRSGWAFSYTGHELGRTDPYDGAVVLDPLDLLDGSLAEHRPLSPAEVDEVYRRGSSLLDRVDPELARRVRAEVDDPNDVAQVSAKLAELGGDG